MPDGRYGCGEESKAPGCHLQKLMMGRQLSRGLLVELDLRCTLVYLSLVHLDLVIVLF
jgi:hypothetical protein